MTQRFWSDRPLAHSGAFAHDRVNAAKAAGHGIRSPANIRAMSVEVLRWLEESSISPNREERGR
jgi:hypothetical protein